MNRTNLRSLLSRLLLPSFLAALPLSSLGCTPGARLEAPGDFATLGRHGGYDFRAASANGVVVGVRREPNDLRASVDYWAGALDARLRRDGYSPDGKKDPDRVVTTARGLAGRELHYTRAEDRRTYCYWLAVFATQDHVYLVEAGGDAEAFEPAKAEVEKAVLSLQTD
jgi:hypothetical protein